MEHIQTLSLSITHQLAGKTVKALLQQEFGLSETLIKRLKRTEGGILLSGVPVFVTARPQVGETLTIQIADTAPPSAEIHPCAIPLSILWEDELFCVLNKPANLAVHPSSTDLDAPSLAGAIVAHYHSAFPPHFVNRLDRGTSGVLVVAKNSLGHSRLQQQLHSRAFIREYRGIVWGNPQPAEGRIELPIGRDDTSLIKRCITPDGASALTLYQTLETHGAVSLLALRPETGRTHQLRLHLSAIGHPLVGDWLYGTEEPEWIARPALHSYTLSFTHPLTKEHISCTAPLPVDMERLLTTPKGI